MATTASTPDDVLARAIQVKELTLEAVEVVRRNNADLRAVVAQLEATGQQLKATAERLDA